MILLLLMHNSLALAQIIDESSGLISTSSGLQILNLSAQEKDSLVDPLSGTIIYQKDQEHGFYYFRDSVWVLVFDELRLLDRINMIVKEEDQSAEDENNMETDSSFVFQLDSNSLYKIEASLEFEEIGNADARLAWQYSADIDWISYGLPGIAISGGHITSLDPSNKISITTTVRTEYLIGIIKTLNEGELSFQFAPFNDNNGTNSLKLNKDSFMILSKL